MTWLKRIFSRGRVESELSEEIREHLEEKIEALVASGMSRTDATYTARREFGNVTLIEENSRAVWRWPSLESFFADLRYALRMLRNSPGFTATAVLTLALGIGVNATMFSMVSAFLLRRPPGREPERVAVVTSVNPVRSFQPDTDPVSVPIYLDWRNANDVFTEIAAEDQNRNANLISQGQPEALQAAAVSPNYFNVLGVYPELGRTFIDGEDQASRDHVAILSHDLWARRFGSDASLIGRSIRLNREDYTVIGVMPASFRMLGFTPQLWTPLVLTAADQTAAARKVRSLFLFARMKPGVTLEQARAEFSALGRRAEENFPETEKGRGVAVRTLPDFLIYSFGIRSALGIIMTTVGFILLIACANVAGLLLARSAGRRKELAIRIALGASKMRVVRQMLTENLVIALFGGGIGLLFAYWGIRYVRASLGSNEAINSVPLNLDWNVLLFALGVSVLCAVLCGFAAALNASKTDANTNLKEEGRGASGSRSQGRLRTVLVTGEIALAIVLLVGTGLIFRGILMIEHQNLGFHTEHLLTAGVTLDSARYKDDGQRTRFVTELLPRLERIAGAQAAAAVSDLPATGAQRVAIRVQGQPEMPNDQKLYAIHVVVSPDYLRVVDIPLLRGRTFTEMDSVNAPRVVLVNQEFVRVHMKDREPLGQHIQVDAAGASEEWSEIVGVVANVKSYSEAAREEPQVYVPLFQQPLISFSLMVRANSDPGVLANDLRAAIGQVDAELPLDHVMSMPAVIERQRGGDALFARLLATFAALALLLAGIGIYGLIAYSVGQRTREIGIRLALGARSPEVQRMVLWEGLRMTAIGTAIGLALAFPLPKLFESMFFDLHFRELRLYFVVPMVILFVSLLATYIPARRASRVDPILALHQE
jgi:putative ABC transport system permease protein